MTRLTEESKEKKVYVLEDWNMHYPDGRLDRKVDNKGIWIVKSIEDEVIELLEEDGAT